MAGAGRLRFAVPLGLCAAGGLGACTPVTAIEVTRNVVSLALAQVAEPVDSCPPGPPCFGFPAYPAPPVLVQPTSYSDDARPPHPGRAPPGWPNWPY
jgi:hypothetical protein